MLKVLQLGGCERGCLYCAERLGGRHRSSLDFTPEELARLFIDLYQQRRVGGLFLSSAIRGGAVKSMDRMLDTADLLRRRLAFRGYLHLKILPGCEPNQIERAMALATRVSLNMEAPTAELLSRLAPTKALKPHILAPMQQIARAQADGRFAQAGQTTQFVVGAAGETDVQIGRSTAYLYRHLKLARIYYSAFQPMAQTPLEELPPTSFLREHRLYQMDFLLRSYGFSIEEIPFSPTGNLDLVQDPKTRWAQQHPEAFPVEINTAEYLKLLRVPGVGPRSAKKMLELRRQSPIRSPQSLRATGAAWRAALPYLLLDGKSFAPRQLHFWG
jgi:predicted DNA-binding helix-hairpin-helix protein